MTRATRRRTRATRRQTNLAPCRTTRRCIDDDNENVIRKQNLKKYNYIFKNSSSSIEDLEKIPAYKRMGIEIPFTEDEINKRLSRFEEEDNLKKEFDYNLINDNFETTFEKIKEIISRNKKED